MARGRDHFNVRLRKKTEREKERKSRKKLQNVISRGAIKTTIAQESHMPISMLCQNESLIFTAQSVILTLLRDRSLKEKRRNEHDFVLSQSRIQS